MSTINLTKGQRIDLTKTHPGETKYAVGLGWDTNKNSGYAFDLDVSAFILGENGKRLSDKHFVYFGNLKSPNNSVVHTGDNLTGDGDGDDETLNIDFSKLEDAAQKIVFVVAIYQAESKGQNFGQVSNAFIRVYNPDTKEEYMRYDLGEDFSTETAVEFGNVYKHNGEWKFQAVGAGRRGGFQDYLNEM